MCAGRAYVRYGCDKCNFLEQRRANAFRENADCITSFRQFALTIIITLPIYGGASVLIYPSVQISLSATMLHAKFPRSRDILEIKWGNLYILHYFYFNSLLLFLPLPSFSLYISMSTYFIPRIRLILLIRLFRYRHFSLPLPISLPFRLSRE